MPCLRACGWLPRQQRSCKRPPDWRSEVHHQFTQREWNFCACWQTGRGRLLHRQGGIGWAVPALALGLAHCRNYYLWWVKSEGFTVHVCGKCMRWFVRAGPQTHNMRVRGGWHVLGLKALWGGVVGGAESGDAGRGKIKGGGGGGDAAGVGVISGGWWMQVGADAELGGETIRDREAGWRTTQQREGHVGRRALGAFKR